MSDYEAHGDLDAWIASILAALGLPENFLSTNDVSRWFLLGKLKKESLQHWYLIVKYGLRGLKILWDRRIHHKYVPIVPIRFCSISVA